MHQAFPSWNMCLGQITRTHCPLLPNMSVAMQSHGHVFLVSKGIQLPDAP